MKKEHIIITQDMIAEAKRIINKVKVDRTIASKIDTLTGVIGEFVFAQYIYYDWKKNFVGKNKGQVDFPDVEVKTSAFPYNSNLNLLVREDYALKRKPACYVQIIIDVENRFANDIKPGTIAIVAGWATSEEVIKSKKKDFGSKIGRDGGYKCYYIPIKELHPMNTFRNKKG